MASHGTGPSFAPLRRKEYRSRRILRQESDRISPQHAYSPDLRCHAEVAVAGVDGERDGAVAAAVVRWHRWLAARADGSLDRSP